MDEKFRKKYNSKKAKFEALECKEFFELSPSELQEVISIQELSLPEFSILVAIGQKFMYTEDVEITVGAIKEDLFRSPAETIAFILQDDIPGFYFISRFNTPEEIYEEFPFPSIMAFKDFTFKFNFTWSMKNYARSLFDRLKEANLTREFKDESTDIAIADSGEIRFFNINASNLFLLIGG